MAFGDPASSMACFDALHDEGKALAADAAAMVKDTITADVATLDGQPAASIVDYAAANAFDLVVMGSHGRGGIQRALIGSVAEGVLRHAQQPVMVIRSSKHSAPVVKGPTEKPAAV